MFGYLLDLATCAAVQLAFTMSVWCALQRLLCAASMRRLRLVTCRYLVCWRLEEFSWCL